MHVIVIGGGIIGLATAYYLSTRDVTVTVCERRALGSGSTERANGGIRAQFTTPANIELSKRSLAVWETFEETFGIDIDFRQHGYLFLTTNPDRAEQFQAHVRIQNAHGIPSEFLTPGDIASYTDLRPEAEIVAGTYSPTDGYADPHSALRGFAESARERGTTIRTNTPVIDLERTTEQYVVSTPDGSLTADAVVNAAGPWSPRVAGFLGLSLPIRRVRRQLALVEPDHELPPTHPYTYHHEQLVSFRPERDRTTIVSGNFTGAAADIPDPDSYSTTVDREFAIGALERLNAFSSYYGLDSKPIGGWAGIYAVTPDHNPIIDEPRPAFYVATGFSGHGFMHAPAVGQYLADRITGSDRAFVDPAPYRLDRFDTTDTTTEDLFL